MTDYVLINDATGLIAAKFSKDQIKSLFPFVTAGDHIDYWENLLKISTQWAGNTLYKKV